MSVPDRLTQPYLRALSEWQEPELAIVSQRLSDGSMHPRDIKMALAGEVTAALYGVATAMKARQEFVSQFSRKRLSDVELPVVVAEGHTVTGALASLGFTKSNGEARRLAEQKGVRLVQEDAAGGDQVEVVLGVDDLYGALAGLVQAHFGSGARNIYLRVGRKAARVEL